MSRINKNKMWMGNPVLRQPSFSFIANVTPAEITATTASFVSYTKSGKTVLEAVSENISVSNDQLTPVFVFGNNITTIQSDATQIESVDLRNMFNVTFLELISSEISTIEFPIKNKIENCNLTINNIKSLDASFINPETITSLDVSQNPFLSDEAAALAFANSLPTVTTSPTLTMASSDTQATAVQSIAEGKGWKVTIS